MDATLEKTLEKSWVSTCKVLFGEELGELSKYESWLAEYLPAKAKRKSHLSGKEVIVAVDSYPTAARFVSENEVVQNRDYALNINQIKDIDSVSQALQEQCEYTGNRYLGNSAFVESSDIVIDSQYVCNSTNIEQSSYMHSSYMMRRGSKHVFGSGWTANGEFLLRLIAGIDLHRCFESHFVSSSSDVYFSHNCDGCHNIMFSFGQKNRDYLIGNLQLPKERYASLKAKLLKEVVAELKKNKRYPSLFELFGNKPRKILPIRLPKDEMITDLGKIEKSFEGVASVILKQKIPKMTELENWLAENTVRTDEIKSSFGCTTYLPKNFGIVSEMPKSRLVSIKESFAMGDYKIDESAITDVAGTVKALDSLAFFSAEYWTGENQNIIKSPLILHSFNVYKGYESTYSENTGMTSLSLHSKYVFGCHRIIDSQFSLKCYNSLYLNRCFELDSCSKCSDSYFCHNSEALSDCMFCFNMKGRRHFIGNTDVGKEKYVEVKGVILAQIGAELEKKKSLKWNIFNIGGN